MQKINILNLKWKMNFFRKKIHLMNMSSNFINIEINDINYTELGSGVQHPEPNLNNS